jgi:hypothetical protein
VPHSLGRRASSDPLVVDYKAEFIYCPTALDTQASCNYADDDDDDDTSALVKRGSKDIDFCKPAININFPDFPSSTDFLENFDNSDSAYGPADLTKKCSDDYTFGKRPKLTTADNYDSM